MCNSAVYLTLKYAPGNEAAVSDVGFCEPCPPDSYKANIGSWCVHYVYMYTIFTYTYVHICIHVYLCIYIYTYTYIYVYLYM